MKRTRTVPPVSLQESDEGGELLDELQEEREHDTSAGPELSAGDVDVVEEMGKAIGVTYQEDEPLRAGEKERERDVHRWELDPASAEDYVDREQERAEEADEIMKMHHEHRQKRSS